MKAIAIGSLLLGLTIAPAAAETLDLTTMTCKQFLDNGADRMTLILAWIDGFYSKSEEAKFNLDEYAAKVKEMLAYCRTNPDAPVESGADKSFGK